MPNLLPNIPFGGLKLNRLSGQREDPGFIDVQLANANAQFIIFDSARPLVKSDENGYYSVVYLNQSAIGQLLGQIQKPIFIGIDENQNPIFVCELTKSFDPNSSFLKDLGEFCELRTILMRTNPNDLPLLGLGRSLYDWHARHGFCSNCGTATNVQKNGWARKCNSCGADHFPRVDPVAIMLVINEDKCLLGRSKNFPPGFYSLLAGFIEPGETIEEGCQREIYEETNIIAEQFKILGSQPWPFPAQLMIGLHAQAKTTEIKIDPEELEDARWFSKDEARQLLSKDGLEVNGIQSFGPRRVAIAHFLLNAWLEG